MYSFLLPFYNVLHDIPVQFYCSIVAHGDLLAQYANWL